MSSINQALRRANRTQDTPVGSFGPLLRRHPRPRRFRRSGLWLVLAGLVAAVSLWVYFQSETKAGKATPQQTPAPAADTRPRTKTPLPSAIPVLKGKIISTTKVTATAAPAPEVTAKTTPAPAPEAKIDQSEPDPGPVKQAQPTAEKKIEAAALKPPLQTPDAFELKGKDKPAAPPVSEPKVPDKAEASAPTPVSARDYFKAGLAAQQKNRPAQAIENYRRAIFLDPGLAEAYLNLGNIFFSQHKDPDKAMEMYEQVLKLNPGNKLAHNNLGVLYLQRGLYLQAEASFGAALEKDEHYLDAIFNLACLAARQGQKSLALSYLYKAAQIDSQAAEWAARDPDLRNLHDLEDYKRFIKHAQDLKPKRN